MSTRTKKMMTKMELPEGTTNTIISIALQIPEIQRLLTVHGNAMGINIADYNLVGNLAIELNNQKQK